MGLGGLGAIGCGLRTLALPDVGSMDPLATRLLEFPYRLLYGLAVIPWPIRDWVYRLVARSRFRLFGRRETCRVPTPEERERFLA